MNLQNEAFANAARRTFSRIVARTIIAGSRVRLAARAALPARVETGNVAVKVAKVAKGEYVRFVDGPNAPVWVRGEYDRASREYSFCRFDDINRERFLKGTKTVFIGFTY